MSPEKNANRKESQKRHIIFVLSDGSGETALNLVRALLTQFSTEDKVFTRRHPRVKTIAQVNKIVESARASESPVLMIYTLVNTNLREHLRARLSDAEITGLDLFSQPLMQLSNFLSAVPEENPNLFHGLNEKYFKRMEAIEFTLYNDDGKRLADLDEADIVLVGVSRTGKTPLSVFLSLYGYKVVNIPLAKGVVPPPELEQIDQRKIVALTIDPSRLAEIRKRRLVGLHVSQSQYSSPMAILDEIEEADAYFRRHRRWPIIDVTNRSIEETAGLVRDKVYGRDRRVL